MVRTGQVLDICFVGRFVDRCDVMCEIKIGIKNDLKNFNLEGWSCPQLTWEGKADDRACLGGNDLKCGFDQVILEMLSR